MWGGKVNWWGEKGDCRGAKEKGGGGGGGGWTDGGEEARIAGGKGGGQEGDGEGWKRRRGIREHGWV